MEIRRGEVEEGRDSEKRRDGNCLQLDVKSKINKNDVKKRDLC